MTSLAMYCSVLRPSFRQAQAFGYHTRLDLHLLPVLLVAMGLALIATLYRIIFEWYARPERGSFCALSKRKGNLPSYVTQSMMHIYS